MKSARPFVIIFPISKVHHPFLLITIIPSRVPFPTWQARISASGAGRHHPPEKQSSAQVASLSNPETAPSKTQEATGEPNLDAKGMLGIIRQRLNVLHKP
jgi:hypothetical protein